MSFPVNANKRTASGGRERSPVEETILEDLEAWHLLNFSSLSSCCFTQLGLRSQQSALVQSVQDLRLAAVALSAKP